MPLPFVDHLGARIEQAKDGASLISLVVQPQHFNSSHVVHGGVLFSLADTGMGAALYPSLAADETCTTVEIKISYFRPVTAGVIVCRSAVLHRGRRMAHLESALLVDEAQVARATGTFAIVARRSPGTPGAASTSRTPAG